MSLLPSVIHKSWDDFLTNEILDELILIEKQVGDNFFPDKDKVLRFLELDLNNLKYVLVGMEPYPTDYKKDNITYPIATGRSFEIANIESWGQRFKQSSLRNIIKAIYFNEKGEIADLTRIRNEIDSGDFPIYSPLDFFNELEKQGVLFLNATLTVEKYNIDTHTKIWEHFVEKLIEYINKVQPTFILMGNKAFDRVSPLIKDNYVKSVHPRVYSFVKDNPFKGMNDINFS